MFHTGEMNGHKALWLENDLIAVTVLPEKGADIYEFIYKPSRVDFLMKSPHGLQPPGETPPADFLENYEGGWQELFPNPGDAVETCGEPLPFHGEVALLPWEFVVVQDDEIATTALFRVRCQKTPFEIERRMRLRTGSPSLEIEETVTNESDTSTHFCWGHHIVLGGNFLEEGCRLDLPAGKIVTPKELYEPDTAQLAPGQCEPWPFALGRKPGERVDLRLIPGPQAQSHDDVYMTELGGGWLEVSNPRLRLSFQVEWDASLFRCLVNWRPLGGADLPPLTGIYGLGIEPWVSRFSLNEAIERSEALELGARGSVSTALRVNILERH